MTPGRRFVHLVLSNKSSTSRIEYSLRHLDAARFFYPTPPPPQQPSALAHRPPSEPSRLPPPVMGFTLPHSSYTDERRMEFMLLGTDKIVAADQTGRAMLYDPARHTVRTMPSLTSPKYSPVALTVNGTDLYVMNAIPNLPSTMHFDGHDHGFDQLAFRSAPGSASPEDHEGDWGCWEHPPIDCEREEPDPRFGIIRAAATVERRDGSSSILVSKYGMGTYAFDTSSQRDRWWCKVGSWMLPFAGQGQFVPKHGLWFGLTSRASDVRDCDTDLLCAVDLGSTTMQQRQRPPTVHGLWGRAHAVVPPVEWGWMPETSRLVNMGNARFCVARFFISGEASTHRYAVIAGVEVEKCGGDGDGDGDAGGLRMVMHRSEVYALPRETMYWVL